MRDDGYSMIELLCVASIIMVVSAAAVPFIGDTLETGRLAAASRHLASRFQLARMEAVKRSAYVGVRFEQRGAQYGFTMYFDRNANGIRTRDIASGIDLQLLPFERLPDQFPGIDFGVLGGVSPVDGGTSLSSGSDPIRFGSSSIASFSPNGSATAGSLYIRSQRHQRAVRVLGVTGRVRTLRFDFRTGTWQEP
jgi:type II secretory pathway pseudopilin PulG